MKKHAFTIAEMVMALAVFGILFAAVMTVYTRMINVKREFDARSYLLTTTYTMIEKMNILLKDYTIDYEQYFNRRMYGCTSVGLMSGRSVGTTGYCTTNAGYGNDFPKAQLEVEGATFSFNTGHILYRCSSVADYINDATYSYVLQSALLSTGAGCVIVGAPQSFGEYRQQFVDVKDNADDSPSSIGDDDDTDLGKGPTAIADNENVPELYLISKDKKSRLLFRRKLVQQTDSNNNGTFQPFERLYVIQMLQLRGFDAGTKHSFNASDSSNQYMYDGQIDTRACDYEKGFICSGTGVNTAIYSGYNLPANAEDGWVNLFGGDVSVANRRMQIYPIKDPIYAWNENDMQTNPYVKLFLTTYLYAPSWNTKIDMKTFDKIFYDLQTMFNIKTNY